MEDKGVRIIHYLMFTLMFVILVVEHRWGLLLLLIAYGYFRMSEYRKWGS